MTIQEFKGKTLVSIREYYKKDGKELPTSKGTYLKALLLLKQFVEIQNCRAKFFNLCVQMLLPFVCLCENSSVDFYRNLV